MVQVVVTKDAEISCDGCEREPHRYRIECLPSPNASLTTYLCPTCFGELLRKAVAVASEMV